MATSRRSLPTSVQSTFSWEELPANLSPLPDSVPDLTIHGEISPLSLRDWLAGYALAGSSGRTSLASLAVTEEGISLQSSQRFGSAGIASATGCWTLNTSEYPSDAVASSLSDILETTGDHLPKYFLSKQACAGILRRAERRGKKLPERLAEALEAVVGAAT